MAHLIFDLDNHTIDEQRCLTCRYWSGCRAEQWDMIVEQGGECMSDASTTCATGECVITSSWSGVDVVSVFANHGCRRWETT